MSCRKIRLPAVVGFIAIGVLSGPHGLQVGPKHNEVAEYASEIGKLLLMLLSMAVAAIAAEAINLEGIIGAFLTGIALNRATHDSPARTDLEFLGNTIAFPCFFLSVGFLIDLRVFAETTVTHFGLVASIVLALILAKLCAALVFCKPFGCTRDEGFIMWSLSMPQVAATLAAALVAFNAKNAAGQRLIDEPVLDSIIVLMVTTSVLGPVLTELFGKRLTAATGPPYDAIPVRSNQFSTTTHLH